MEISRLETKLSKGIILFGTFLILFSFVFQVKVANCAPSESSEISTWIGHSSAFTKTTIAYDNWWENNEAGEMKDIYISIEEYDYAAGEIIYIINISVFVWPSNEIFEETNVNWMVYSGNPFSTSISLIYTGEADEIECCLTVEYEYTEDGGSTWYGGTKTNLLCVLINTSDSEPVSGPIGSTHYVIPGYSFLISILFVLGTVLSLICLKKRHLLT